jgi:REP element-mobilizing transposase RayT
MDEHIYKRHNKTLLLYHIVFPVKYRKKIIGEPISLFIKDICLEIGERYEIVFIEIGADEDHIHFLVQSVPTMTVDSMVRTIKSITAREVFLKFPEVKKELWGGNFWTSGYYANTVGQYGNADVIKRYVENQGRKYSPIHVQQLSLW